MPICVQPSIQILPKLHCLHFKEVICKSAMRFKRSAPVSEIYHMQQIKSSTEQGEGAEEDSLVMGSVQSPGSSAESVIDVSYTSKQGKISASFKARCKLFHPWLDLQAFSSSGHPCSIRCSAVRACMTVFGYFNANSIATEVAEFQ